MISASEENYLKTVLLLQQLAEGSISTNDIAQKLSMKASSASEMVQKLADKGLLKYKKYYGVQLTRAGKTHALMVIRKHRLWETFLVNSLGFGWDEVHDVAEQLEHVRSQKLMDAIDRFLLYPKYDPHGDPIPDKNGRMIPIKSILLSECAPKSVGKICGVEDASAAFLKHLNDCNISIGASFQLLNKEIFDGTLNVQINGENHFVSHIVASNLRVELS